MLNIERIQTDLFEANSYIISTESETVVVVDPGFGAATKIAKRLQELDKTVGAVLLTHGHADHVWDAEAVSRLTADGVPAPIYLPPPDRDWLEDPLGKLGMPDILGIAADWSPPQDVRNTPTGNWAILPEVVLLVVPAPGHSAGSSIILLGGTGTLDGNELGEAPLALSGDVVFRGSVGRTDLSGGDEYEMRESLRTLAGVLDPRTVLLPGHGPETTWGGELENNPYVRRARSRNTSPR